MRRSAWKIPRAALEAADLPIGDLAVYHESPQFVYALAPWPDMPDLEALGATREDLADKTARGRYVRSVVRRAKLSPKLGEPPDEVLRVRPADVKGTDEVLEEGVPAILYAGDVAADVLEDSG